MSHAKEPLTPAILLVGSQDATATRAIEILREQLCAPLPTHQHHALLWLAPETGYKLEDLEPVFERLAFANAQDELFFFVFENAHALGTACANALLKSVEEPPAGYHFIFLTQTLSSIVPTIRSRCHTIHLESARAPHEQFATIIAHFGAMPSEPSSFLSLVDRSTLSDHDMLALLNALFENLSTRALTGDTRAATFIPVIHKYFKKPPMPGSSKLYLKQLYLDWHAQKN